MDQGLEALEDLLSFHPLLRYGNAGPRCRRRIRVPCRDGHGTPASRTASQRLTSVDSSSPRQLSQSVRAQANLRLTFRMFVLLARHGAISYWGPNHPETHILDAPGVPVGHTPYNPPPFSASR